MVVQGYILVVQGYILVVHSYILVVYGYISPITHNFKTTRNAEIMSVSLNFLAVNKKRWITLSFEITCNRGYWWYKATYSWWYKSTYWCYKATYW
jgi:hypothetical protein